MNKKLFVLPLVALLVGCNSSTPLKDVFKQIRNTEIEESVKEEVLSNYYGYQLINNSQATMTIEYESETSVDTSSSIITGTMHCNPTTGDGSFLLSVNLRDQENEYASVLFEDGVYTGSLVDGFPLSLEKTYNLYKDLIFSWNCSLVGGNLGAAYNTEAMTTASIYKQIANALKIEGSVQDGTFTASAVGPFVQKEAGVKAVYKNFVIAYENYKLCDYGIEAIITAKGNGYSMTQVSTVTTSVTYFLA